MVRGLSHLSLFSNAHHRPMRSHAGAPARANWRGFAPIAVLLCAALGGCAGGMQSIYTNDFWVQPGKYDFLKCPDLATQSVGLSQNEQRLMSLMERAKQDAAGSIINVAVYQAQLDQTRASLEAVQRTAREKGCDNMVPTPKK